MVIDASGNAAQAITRCVAGVRHPLARDAGDDSRPGLILFSSGSTGRAKAMLHDFDRLLKRYETPQTSCRILSFLHLDHIGGLNTLFYGLAHGGTIISTRDRRPESVCQAIERYRVEVLPTSPTFLNLLLVSGEHCRHDLSSLQLITYGTEVMPSTTLERLRSALPGVRLRQTYGLSELGILRCKGLEDGSLWVKVGGEGFETRVVDGVLWVRAHSALAGVPERTGPIP